MKCFVKARILALGLLGMLIMGCNAQQGITGQWILTSLSNNGKEVAVKSSEGEVFVAFDEGKFNGNAGCNNFFGGYTFDKGVVTTSGVGMTRKMCDPASMAIEDTLVKVFADSSSQASLSSDTLTLEKNGVRAVFQRKP